MGTPIHGKRYVETFNSVTICSATANLDIAADAAEVTTSCDDTKAFLQGKYGWTAGSSGPTDFADNGMDETIYTNVIGGGNQVLSIKANSGSTGAANPLYSGSAFVTSYGLSFDQANAVQASISYQGTAALARATA
jgi:hypothetical protein